MTAPAPLEPARDATDYDAAVQRVRRVAAELHAQHRESFPHWVVLGPGTTDLPGAFLARLWVGLPDPRPTSAVVRAGTLDEIRVLLPPGLFKVWL